MKRTLSLMLAVVLMMSLCFITACSDKEKDIVPETVEDCYTLYKDVFVDDDSIVLDVKIPQLTFTTDTAKVINAEILAQFYTDDIQNALDGGFTNVQVYVKPKMTLYNDVFSMRIDGNLYPSYGTDGDVYIINYDTKTGERLSAEETIALLGHDYETVMADLDKTIKDLYGNTVVSTELKGVFIYEDGTSEIVSYVNVKPVGADAWQSVCTMGIAAK